jgi:hypothetical protein
MACGVEGIVSGFVYRLVGVDGICVLASSSTHKFKIVRLLVLRVYVIITRGITNVKVFMIFNIAIEGISLLVIS